MTVGTFQDTSPMSSDPPPVLSASSDRPLQVPTRVASPCSRMPSSFCTARASVWSASLHCGMPTFWMFALAASATARLKCCGQADPSTRVGSSVVSVIIAAPCAILSPIAHMSLMP